MYAHTLAFRNTIKQSHVAVTKVYAQQGGQRTVLDVTAGKIVQSLDDASRWSLDLSIIDTQGRTFDQMRSLLRSRITTYAVSMGVQYSDGTQELLPYGVFYPTAQSFNGRQGSVSVTVKAFDQSSKCQNDLVTPVYITSGQLIVDAVPQILRAKRPKMKFNLPRGSWTTPVLIMQENIDPWQTSLKLMGSTGQDLYLDRLDVCTARARKLQADVVSVWDFTEGVNADFWDPEHNYDDDLVPNVVVVIGDNPAAPGVIGVAFDNDPQSEWYRYGEGGEVVRTFHSEFVLTVPQANQLASYLLSRLLGPQDEVTFTAIRNPALDAGDTVTITCARLGLNNTRMIVSEIEADLVQPTMNVRCRRSILADSEGNLVRA